MATGDPLLVGVQRIGKEQLQWTANKLLQGAGVGADPTEIDVPAGTGDFKADGSIPLTGDIDFAGTQQCHDLQAPAAAGEAVRQTVKITEVSLESAVDLTHTQGTDQGLDTGGANAVVVADVKDAVTKKHSANGDTDLDATFEATFVKHADVDDVPVDGVTTDPVSSNWAYDHAALATAHGLVAATDPSDAAQRHVMEVVNGASAWSVQDLFDATSPVTQAIVDAASAGTSLLASHRDHKHAMPSQATMDTASVAAVAAAGAVLADAKAIEYTTPSASHTASGIFKTKTAGTALVFGDACYMGTDGKMEKALADDAAVTIPATHLCIATIAENATGLFLEQGEAHDDSWAFDIGLSVYLSAATAGLITKTMPIKVTGNQVQVLGLAIAADTIFWNPSPIVMEYA